MANLHSHKEAKAGHKHLHQPQPAQAHASVHQHLFGIRRPLSIFNDQSYKHNLMRDEMIAYNFFEASQARAAEKKEQAPQND